MSRKIVLVMPGTVAMPPAGVLADLAKDYPQIVATLQEIDQVGVDFDAPSVLNYLTAQEDSPVGDPSAEMLYLALFGVSISVYQVLIAEGVEPYAVTGHSIGEIIALVAAGSLTIKDAAQIICLRSQALTKFNWPGALLALGVSAEKAGLLVDLIDHPDLAIACINAPQQTLLSGPRETVEQLTRIVEELNWPQTQVHVPHPTHSPGVASAAAEFMTLAANIKGQPPLRRRIYSAFSNQWLTDMDQPVNLVAYALTKPVRFLDAVRVLHAQGVDTFIECGATELLVKSIRASLPDVQTLTPLSYGAEAVSRLRTFLGDGTSVIPEPRHEPVKDKTVAISSTVTQGSDREEVLARLRKLYAVHLEYPEEVFEEHAELEADLGCDSLRQMELLRKTSEEFSISALRTDVRLIEYPTLGRIADAIMAKVSK